MRLLLTKIAENPTLKTISVKSTFNITRRYKFDYLLMHTNNDEFHKLWFGQIGTMSQQIHSCHFIEFNKNQKVMNFRTSMATYASICGKETWYGITEETYKILENIKTTTDLLKILDNFTIENDLNISLYVMTNLKKHK